MPTDSERLLHMVRELRAKQVEELSHLDWHATLKAFQVLILELEPHANTNSKVRNALRSALARATRDRLPTDTRQSSRIR